jgi:hypothetical protein
MKGQWESNINVWFHLCIPRNKTARPCYFQNRIIMVCLPISTFMSLWAIYILPQSVCRGPIVKIYKLLTSPLVRLCTFFPRQVTVLSLLSGRLVIINSNSCLQNHSPCWHRPFGGWFYITAGLQPYTQMVYNDTWFYAHDLYFSKKAFSLNKKYSVGLYSSI